MTESNTKIRVAILDDHPMVIQGLRAMLDSSEGIEVGQTFLTGKEFKEGFEPGLCNVLLLDINLPDANGIELSNELLKKFPDLNIIALSNYNETGYIKNMMRNGAKGYLLKNTRKDELVIAINKVVNGHTYLPSSLKELLLNDSLGLSNSNRFIPKLSRRESEILELISNELTTQEIADKLFLSVKTVESHRKNLFQKLHVRNTAGLIKVAITKGLLS